MLSYAIWSLWVSKVNSRLQVAIWFVGEKRTFSACFPFNGYLQSVSGMNLYATFRSISLLLVLCLAGTAMAQQKPVTAFPAPHNGPKKKKDTTRPNPYLVDTLLKPIPFYHYYIHDKIDKELRKADLADGREDSFIHTEPDSALARQLSEAFYKKIPRYKILIENLPIAGGRDSVMENQQKLRCLTAIWEMLRQYNGEAHPDAGCYINLVANLHGTIVAANEGKLLEFARLNPNWYTLDNGRVMMEGQPDVKAFIYTTLGLQDPQKMIRRLSEFAADTFAGRIIAADARIEPELTFNYALSTNKSIRGAIEHTDDTLVRTIVAIADRSMAPLKAINFLADIFHNRSSIRMVDSIARNPDAYYRGLVRLEMEHESVGRYFYERELQYRTLLLVRKMNDLHEAKDAERFAGIDSLQPQDLYYLSALGQDEIYTSSYLGVFKRILERIRPNTGRWLLDTVHSDHFRTFIRMAAGYNTLSSFLATMNDSDRNGVMTEFTDGLQHGRAEELEDAVDVADAFGSIRDSALLAFLESRVKYNYEQAYAQKSKKGLIIYSLLARLFEGNKISDNDTGAAVASQSLHLPDITKVPYKALTDDSGVVYQQVFFFGDEDGEKSFRSFLSIFTDKEKWSVDTSGDYWVVITGLGTHKTVIYANKPLAAPDDEDAQNRLCSYLAGIDIKPTIMIHRGHSYHLPLTMAKLNKDVRIVVLGSCGGYHNLSLVLDRAPDAHIISSKQTGTMWVNEPILTAINGRITDGADISWISIWNELGDYFAKRPGLQEKFDDYVPPHKNLGALFIKAYRQVAVSAAMPKQK